MNNKIEQWVDTLNAVEHDLIVESVRNNIDNWIELTKPYVGSYDYNTNNTIKSIDYDNDTYMVEDDEEEYDIRDVEIERYDFLPMWGTMWTFDNSYEENWVRDHLYEFSEMGFRVYEYGETGTLYFGIEGAGYNFYEAHWKPLYEALYGNN